MTEALRTHRAATIVLTREPDDNAPLAQRLSGEGLNVVEYPCIATRLLPWDPTMLPPGLTLQDFAALAFASRRGVLAVPPEAVALAVSARLAAVGKATAALIARRFGRVPDVVATTQDAEGLAAELLPLLPARARVLLFRGDRTTGLFQAAVRDAGMELVEFQVYCNETPRLEPLELPGMQSSPPVETVVVLSSPSIVERFFAVNPALLEVVHVVAFGATTARRATELGCPRVRCASSPATESVAEAVFFVLSEVVP